jgi:hypothetical protein
MEISATSDGKTEKPVKVTPERGAEVGKPDRDARQWVLSGPEPLRFSEPHQIEIGKPLAGQDLRISWLVPGGAGELLWKRGTSGHICLLSFLKLLG